MLLFQIPSGTLDSQSSRSFREGALLGVNLGDDADTTGAVYGQLAGAFYGEQRIPEHWRATIARREEIESVLMRDGGRSMRRLVAC